MSIGIDISQTGADAPAKLTPPWIAKKKKMEDRKAWFAESLNALETFSEERITTHVNNILWYTGEYDKTAEYKLTVPGQSEKALSRKILPRIFAHLYDITEQRVSKLSRYKPTFEVVPTNTEQTDWKQARLYKICLDALARRSHMDFLMQEVERWNAVCGEVLITVRWNKNIGDRVKPGSIERVGDVEVSLKEPWTWLPEPKRHRSDVLWGIDLVEILHVEEAKKRYGKNIKPDGKKYVYSFNSDLDEKREDEIVVYRVIEKPSEFSPDGTEEIWIGGELIDELKSDASYPYSHMGFDFEWYTDIDIPGRLFPLSFYQHLKPVQNVYNKLTSMMVRNATLVGHPHILMPKGAAKIEAFGNAPTAIEFSGPVEPKIATFNSIPQDFFAFRKEVLGELSQISGIQGISRGAPPSNTRAASMLRFYEEQEEQRASTQIIKHNELIRSIYLKAASIMGDYYPSKEGKARLIRVLGENNRYMIEEFTGSKPSSEYDVNIINSSGFSESRAGRLEELELIEKIAPGLMTQAQKADVLELKNTQKAYDIMTSALKHAEQENEMFLDGKKVPPPKPYQDLIVHWTTHSILFNSSTWEMNVPEESKEEAYLHQMATERLMEEKARVNAAFAQQLAMLPGYPSFWSVTPAPPVTTASLPAGGLSSAPENLQTLDTGMPSPAAPPPLM